MLYKYIFFFFCFLASFFSALADIQNNILDVDFVQSVTDGNKVAKAYFDNKSEEFKFFKELYETKKPSKMFYSKIPIIPKVMHHIWFGGEMPPLFEHYFRECQKLHPEWEFKIWNAQQIKELNLEYKDLYSKARNYPGRADIARYEILYRFGGVYRDIDVKCIRPIDDLNHKYDFYVPFEFPMADWQVVVNNGVIGTRPNHPILKTTLEIIRKNIDKEWQYFDSGDASIDDYQGMVAKTSMLPLTKGFIEHVKPYDKAVALPSSYFWGLAQLKYHDFFTALKYMIFKDSNNVDAVFSTLKPETLMHHNYSKQEIFTMPFDYGNGLDDPQVKTFFRHLVKSDQRVWRSFEKVYQYLNPSKASWNKKNKTPAILHFIIFDEEENYILEQRLANWRLLNSDLDIQIWDIQRVYSTFHLTNQSILQNSKENFRFYIALKILEQFGGNYADFRVVARKPIFELYNKYNFYVSLAPLTKPKIMFSQKLIGSSPNHPIISKVLEAVDLENLSTFNLINENLVNKAHTNLYIYDDVSARNVILPATYFEPIAELPNDSIWDKIYRFIFRVSKAFVKVRDYAVIE